MSHSFPNLYIHIIYSLGIKKNQYLIIKNLYFDLPITPKKNISRKKMGWGECSLIMILFPCNWLPLRN